MELRVANLVGNSPNFRVTIDDTLIVRDKEVLKWFVIETNESPSKEIEWVPMDIKEYPLFERNNTKTNQNRRFSR